MSAFRLEEADDFAIVVGTVAMEATTTLMHEALLA